MYTSTMMLSCLAAIAIASSSWSVATAFRIPSPPSSASAAFSRIAVVVAAGADKNLSYRERERDDDDDGAGRHGAVASTSSSSSRNRRSLLVLSSSLAAVVATDDRRGAALASSDVAGDMYSPKFVQTYEDFVTTPDGWSYKDVRVGTGDGGTTTGGGGGGGALKVGDRVVFDWSGYTIGYFGRPFEAKGGPRGGAFDKDVDYFRAVLGSESIVPGLDGALRTMRVGGVRQVIIPYGPLSYPPDDPSHDVVGPRPTTFSGMRALNFVLENPRVDRTLLFNVKLVRVDRADGKGGFVRG